MKIPRGHFYNPFLDSYLGVLIENPNGKENDIGFILEDVDLFHQPVPNPMIAGIFCLIMSVSLFTGIYLHHKVWAMLKKDYGMLCNVTKIFVIAQMVLCSLSILLVATTNIVHTFPDEVTQYVCPPVWFLIYLSINTFGFHSFITALMRYCFIVHTEKVDSWGKDKVKNLFEFISVFIPLFLTTLKALDGSDLDTLSFVNKCYNEHHEVFLLKRATINVVKTNICDVPGYEDMEGHTKYMALGKKSLCFFLKNITGFIMLIMGSNISEAFIYYKLFTHIQR